MRKFNITLLILALLGFVGFLFFKSDTSSVEDLVSNSKTGEVTKKTYESADYKFSFEYEDDFVITPVSLDVGNKIVFELTEQRKGFQITIFPFDEPGPLTEERIKKDLPDLVILDAKSVTVGGVEALQFKSVDENVGNTFEVWFIYSGNLYQIQVYEEFGGALTEILKTWKFK